MTNNMKVSEVWNNFRQQYDVTHTDAILAIECDSCGSDYGTTSWTTRAEANRVRELLGLTPTTRLLEIGAGAGWPGLYLSRTSGCSVVLTDMPHAGLNTATGRAVTDGLADACLTVAASATALPFSDGAFDAISHSDVLCCLPEKKIALQACRNAVQPEGKMVFSVISVTPGLSGPDHEAAVENGPPYIETDATYAALLEQTDWRIEVCYDMTGEFVETNKRVVEAQNVHKQKLLDQFGEEDTNARIKKMVTRLSVREAGLHRRELYVVTPNYA